MKTVWLRNRSATLMASLAFCVLPWVMGCDAAGEDPSGGEGSDLNGAAFALQDPPPEFYPYPGEGAADYRVSSGTIAFEGGRYEWRLVLESPSGEVLDTLVLGGRYSSELPIVQFDGDEPFFGVVGTNAITLYTRFESEPLGRRAYTLAVEGEDWDTAPRLPVYREDWSSGSYDLERARGEALPVLSRAFGRGRPTGGRELVYDTLRSGTLTLNQDNYRLEVRHTRHVSGTDEIESAPVDAFQGRFYQEGNLLLFVKPDCDAAAHIAECFFFGVSENRKILLYRSNLGFMVREDTSTFGEDV